MPVVTLSEADLRGGDGGFRKGGGRGDGSGRKDTGRSGASAGAQERQQAFQGRGHRLGSSQAPRPSFRHAVGIWLRKWQSRRKHAARHAVAERQRSGLHIPSAPAKPIRSHKLDCTEPTDTDSDKDTSPQQSSANLELFREAKVAARLPDMTSRRAGAAPVSQPSAVAESEASASNAAPRPRAPQHTENRRLGISDPSSPNDGTQEAARRNGDWMWGGDGAYVPSPGTAMDMTLRLHETVYVFDMGLTAHPARAMLDSGNASYTLISRRFAASLGLIDDHGRPRQNSIQTTTVLGAVAGASEEIPLMKINYELRGRRMLITAGVSEAQLGCDLLLSRREIAEFLSSGFTFDVR